MAASDAEVAQITLSKASPSTRQCGACQRRLLTRWPQCTRAWPGRSAVGGPEAHTAAAAGNKLARSTRGSSKWEPPRMPNKASCSTLKNTWALASAAGVLSAETHRGSISSCNTRGVMLWHRSATVALGAHLKPCSCQPSAPCISDQRSAHDQPRAVAMAAKASSGAGHCAAHCGVCRPLPSIKGIDRGWRSSKASGSSPTTRIRRRVSV